jgi:hypothetical protein
VIAIRLDQFAAGGKACELFEEANFADKLLIAGALAGGALDAAEQIAVILSQGLRPARRLEMGTRQRVWYRLIDYPSGKD